jgi:hypothetical protein
MLRIETGLCVNCNSAVLNTVVNANKQVHIELNGAHIDQCYCAAELRIQRIRCCFCAVEDTQRRMV